VPEHQVICALVRSCFRRCGSGAAIATRRYACVVAQPRRQLWRFNPWARGVGVRRAGAW
jgi:hypothetical protein